MADEKITDTEPRTEVKEKAPEVQTEATTPSSTPEKSTPEASEEQTDGVEQTSRIDPVWLKETLEIINWHRSDYKTARSWISSQLKAPVEGTIAEVVNSLKDYQLQTFCDHIRIMKESRRAVAP